VGPRARVELRIPPKAVAVEPAAAMSRPRRTRATSPAPRARTTPAVGHDPEVARTGHAASARTLAEHAGKAALAAFGVNVPRSRVVSPQEAATAARDNWLPRRHQGTGSHLEHKSEVGAVALNIRNAADAEAAAPTSLQAFGQLAG